MNHSKCKNNNVRLFFFTTFLEIKYILFKRCASSNDTKFFCEVKVINR